MKQISIIALACLLQSAVHAEVIVHDAFDYPEGATADGLSGGTGWLTPWSVKSSISSATIQGGSLVIGDGKASPMTQPGKPAVVARKVESYGGAKMFIKYTFTLGPGTSADPDRFYLDLRGKGADGGWGTLEIGTGLAHDVHSERPDAVADTRITARVFSTHRNRAMAPEISLTDETPYTVIVEFSKSTADEPTAAYDTIRIWVNPSAADYAGANPRKLDYRSIMRSFQSVAICVDEVEAGDVFKISEFVVATTWEDVVNAADGAPAAAPKAK